MPEPLSSSVPPPDSLQHSPEGALVQFRESPIPSFLWRREEEDFVLIAFNTAAEHFTQRRIERFMGMKATAMYPDVPQIPADMRRCWSNRASFKRQMTYRLRSTDEVKDIVVTYIPLQPSLVLVHVEDLTEQRQAEVRLRESEDRFRAVVEMTPVPFLIVRICDGQILYANPILRRIAGDKASELVGQSTARYYAQPGDRDRLLQKMLKEGSLRNFELPAIRPDGRPAWFSVSANLIRYEGEDCALATVIDLSEQKLIEHALTTLAATATAGSRDSQELLQSLVDQLAAVLHACLVVLAQINQNGQLEARVFAGRLSEAQLARALAGSLWQENKERIFLCAQDLRAHFPEDSWLGELKAESAGVYPLFDTQGRKVGLLGLIWDQPLPKGGWAEKILGVFALRAAAELVRERAEREIKRAQETVREYALRQQGLSRQLLRSQEAERRRIAHELHDEIGQALTAVQLNLAALLGTATDSERGRRVQESMDIVDRVLEQAHDLSLDLRPPMLDDLGLAAALRWYADRLAQRADLELRLEVDEIGRAFDTALETACFRVAQEALTNVARHARAATVTVTLRQTTQLELDVQDDGVGFDPARVAGQPRLGLLGMEEQVSLVGGRLEIDSQSGRGTAVRARFPLAGQGEGSQP